MPIGIVAAIFATYRLKESFGPDRKLDLAGLGLASVGLIGVVWGVIHANEYGWGTFTVLGSIGAGIAFVAAFLWWEARSDAPMLPLRFFRNRTFLYANGASFLMFFGVFGAVFLMTQFLQFVQGYSPFEAGLRTLPWTGMPAIVAPIAGALAGRIGGRPLLVAGLAMMAIGLGWFAAIATPDVAYSAQVPAFVLAGIGMGLFFAPVAAVILSAVTPSEEGKASGAANAIRELGGVFGVAVLAAVFAGQGTYFSGQSFVDGLVPAVWVGAILVAIAAVMAALIPGRRSANEEVAAPPPLPGAAAQP